MVEDSLSANAITDGLKTHFIGQKALYYPSLTSTMEVARQVAREGAAEGTVIIADEQTAGKGRLKRSWLTPKGNIALSVILRPGLSALPALIMLASLAVVHGIEAVTGLKPQIKWPNDILVNGKKIAGILIENDVLGNRVTTIIGIGIDVNLRLADFPEIQAIATSLSDKLGHEVSRLKVIRALLVEMERLYLPLSAGGSQTRPYFALFDEWRDNLVTLGKKVRVTAEDATYEGIAESVDTDGSLLLRRPDGTLTRVVAGDVTLR
ncbi:MAG: biotin--[acetyl-CoA-carboxylase] ligase [Chloroflexi bacterium]|nr:biotin--[acetyl-CoA-carboxylase] ligase [Chloroflexota bacterium]